MTLIRSAAFNGLSSWSAAQSIQVDSSTYTPAAVPNGVAGSLDFVPDPAGQRGTVLRAQVPAYSTGTYGNRAEVNFPSESVSVGNPVCRWYRWGVMIPSAGYIANDRYFSFAQIHDEPDGGDAARWPNLVLYAGAGEVLVMLPRVDPPTNAGDAGSRVAARYPLVRDVWMDFQLGINLSVEAGGWIELSINNNLVLKEFTHGTAYDDVTGPWLKLGIYNIFKHTSPSGNIATAYYSATEHHGPPFAPGVHITTSLSAAP